MRSSASECASWSAPGGSWPSSRSTDSVARLQQPDQRREDDEEAPHRRGDGQRRPLRMAERDALRDELAEHDVEEGDQEQREHYREHGRERRLEGVREHGLAQRADRQRGHRHAELHRGDEAGRVGGDAQHGAGTAVPLRLELADAGAP